jgi:hypothetical protein
LETGKSYVGQTVSHVLNHGKYRKFGSEKRFKSHISEAINDNKKKQCTYLNNAIRKYGGDNFVFEILHSCLREDADAMESFYIEQNDTLAPNGYNIKNGGQNFIHTSESKKKVSEGVTKFYYSKRMEKYKDFQIPEDIEPNDLIHPLKRDGCLFGYYVLYKNEDVRIKTDFGGSNIDVNESYERAVEFIKWLQSDF